MLKILVTAKRMLDQVEDLRKLLDSEVEFILPKTGTDQEILSLIRDVDIILCRTLSERMIEEARNLKLIQKTGAGVDEIAFESLHRRNIYVANLPGVLSIPVAEHAFALLLALGKKIVLRHNLFLKGVADRTGTLEIKGKTLGILGLGSIGVELARRATAFGMTIIATRRHPEKLIAEDFKMQFLGGPNSLDFVLQKSDFVVICLPLTPETRNILGENELKQMKRSAFLVNVARADIVNEEALWNALTNGWIAGAALDAWYGDPWWESPKRKPSNYPIWKLQNVIATPHVAADTEVPSRRGLEIIAANISRIAHGEEPIGRIDPMLLY